MLLHAAILLGLGLWLEPTFAQRLLGPRPSISAQPGPKVILGHPVTIVCSVPAWADKFQMVKKHRKNSTEGIQKSCDSLDLNCGSPDQTPMNCDYMDQTTVSRDDSYNTEAQFPIQAVCEGSAGSYHCRYQRDSQWSVFSDTLELVVTSKDDSNLNTVSEQDSVPSTLHPPSEAPSTLSWSPSVVNQVRLGLASGILLALMGILAEAWYSSRRSKEEAQ